MHWYLLSADSRPFLRHLTLPPLSPDTYESLVLAYLGIFLFDTDHLDIADRSAIDIWPSLPCLQTRTSLTCISIPRNLFFLMQILFFFWCVYHVEILDSSIEVQGNIFFDANQFLFWYLWGYFFLMRFYFFWSFTHRLCHCDSSSLMWLSTTWCDLSVSPLWHGDDVTFPTWCDLSTVLVSLYIL